MAQFVAEDRGELVVLRGDGFLQATLELGALADGGLGRGQGDAHLAKGFDFGGIFEGFGRAAIGEPAAERFEAVVDDVDRGVGFLGTHGHGGEGFGLEDEQLAAVGFEGLAIGVVAGQVGAEGNGAEVSCGVAEGAAVFIDGHAGDATLDVLGGFVADLGALVGGKGEGALVLLATFAAAGGAFGRGGVVLDVGVAAGTFAGLALAVLEGVACVAGRGQEPRIGEVRALVEEVFAVLGDGGAVFEVVEEAFEAVGALAIGAAVGVHLEDAEVDTNLDEIDAVGPFEEARGDLSGFVGPVVEDCGEVVGHAHFCEVAFHALPPSTIRNDAGSGRGMACSNGVSGRFGGCGARVRGGRGRVCQGNLNWRKNVADVGGMEGVLGPISEFAGGSVGSKVL